jgi:hypothetical protein
MVGLAWEDHVRSEAAQAGKPFAASLETGGLADPMARHSPAGRLELEQGQQPPTQVAHPAAQETGG